MPNTNVFFDEYILKPDTEEEDFNDFGRPGIDARRVIGAVIIKHKRSDEETVLQIQENPYLQYFLGYTRYEEEPVFAPSLFVAIRKRIGANKFDEMNLAVIETAFAMKKKRQFGQGKNGYSLNYIRAKLQAASENWISCIFLVMNIVKLSVEKINSLFYYASKTQKSILRRFFDLIFCIYPEKNMIFN